MKSKPLTDIQTQLDKFKWRVWRESWLYHKYLCFLKNKVGKLEEGRFFKPYKVKKNRLFGSWDITDEN